MFKKPKCVLGMLAAIAISCLGAGTARAGLFSSIEYNQYVEASPPAMPGVQTVYKTLSGTTLPVNQTLSIDLDGETSQATYNFTDNGTTAELNIISSFHLNAPNEDAGEASEFLDDKFEFKQPVSYSISLEDTADGTFEGLPPFVQINLATGQALFSLGGPAPTGDFQKSGTFDAGVVYVMDEEFLVNNSYPGDSPTGSGSDDVTLTFTAIPEPSSLGMLILGGAAVLARRGRARV